MIETVPTKRPRRARAKHPTRGCALALGGFMFLAVAAALFFAGQPSWPFFLALGLGTYLSASIPPGRAKRRRRRAALPPAHEPVTLPKPPRVRATSRRIKVPVAQFDAEGRTPLERALQVDDAEQ